jgi:hypothetical protein
MGCLRNDFRCDELFFSLKFLRKIIETLKRESSRDEEHFLNPYPALPEVPKEKRFALDHMETKYFCLEAARLWLFSHRQPLANG